MCCTDHEEIKDGERYMVYIAEDGERQEGKHFPIEPTNSIDTFNPDNVTQIIPEIN